MLPSLARLIHSSACTSFASLRVLMDWTLLCGSQKLSVIVRLVPVDDFLDYDGFNVIVAPTRRCHDPAVPAVVPRAARPGPRRLRSHLGTSPCFSKVLMCRLQFEWASLRRSVNIALWFATNGRGERLSVPCCGDITQHTFVEPKRSGMRGVTVLEGLVTVWSRWDSYSGVVRQMPSRSKDAQAHEASLLGKTSNDLTSQGPPIVESFSKMCSWT